MPARNWNFIGRRPRHSLAGDGRLDVEIGRPATGGQRLPAELVDFSRQGTRFRTAAALAKDEPIIIFLREAAAALDLALAGVVRWRASEEADRWLYGCQFMEELPLETLGELFLSGILAAHPPASPD